MTSSFNYDIAISFAGEDRIIARKIAEGLKFEGLNVFFDEFKEEDLWGRNGYEYFVDVFAHKSEYCLMLISEHYKRKVWTNHERRAAQSRAIKEEEPYILPLRLDDTELPGEIHTVFYQDLRQTSIEEIISLLLKKLKKKNKDRAATPNREQSNIDNTYNIKMPTIKKRYSDLEKQEFLESGYRFIEDYLKIGLQMLDSNEPSVATTFEEEGSQTCTGSIHKDGKLIQGFRLWIGGMFKNQSICLRLGKHNIQRSENSYNEIITVEERKNELWLNVMMGSLNFGHSKELKTKKDIAEYLWTAITGPLEY